MVVLPVDEASTDAGKATITRVRNAARHVAGAQVGGPGVLEKDAEHAIYGPFFLLLALIGLITFVLLTRAFRSIVLALKAVVLNLLSVAASYGVLVLVWQDGHGSHAIWGVPATGAITFWVPLMSFAFLYGLSMDYEVFILARMREEYDTTADTRTAIIEGLGRTGRLVTSAALILFLAFVSLATAPDTDIKILATALGAGILLDATVVRSLLLPAAVSLFGRWNWWLPDWAARLLRIPPAVRPLPKPPRPSSAEQLGNHRREASVNHISATPGAQPCRHLLNRLGLPVGPMQLLTVPGRRSGLPRTTPVTPVVVDGVRVHHPGVPNSDWVKNARASGVDYSPVGAGRGSSIWWRFRSGKAQRVLREFPTQNPGESTPSSATARSALPRTASPPPRSGVPCFACRRAWRPKRRPPGKPLLALLSRLGSRARDLDSGRDSCVRADSCVGKSRHQGDELTPLGGRQRSQELFLDAVEDVVELEKPFDAFFCDRDDVPSLVLRID